MMKKDSVFHQQFNVTGGDFVNAGESSCEIRNILKELGTDGDIIRRTAIATYEAEMNVVMYARDGIIDLCIHPHEIKIIIRDHGYGIPDVDQAMQPGFSTATKEMREMGFGAGMGLPNIEKNADTFVIESKIEEGTTLTITFALDHEHG
jgi:anti-sigma regulatory factor (Ser/Thr protein kinase)